jgi:MOSC domain-containing protein YiiM
MRSAADLEEEWVARSPTGTGAISLLVLRKGEGVHETPDSIELCTRRGILGDRWSEGAAPKVEAQVTLMNLRAARLVVGELPLHLPGDNLLVDLDLSEEALPVGSRLKLGAEAVVEVSALPHTGCSRFADRFGVEALKWVNAAANRPRKLRGINCRVITPGRVALGDVARLL